MEIYYSYHLDTNHDEVVAFLSELGFESFVEEGLQTIAYIPKAIHDENLEKIKELLHAYEVTYENQEVPPQNWNALWEESFQPVVIDNFCMVRADFHAKNNAVKYDIIINPKMAFGTGHHSTTYMVLDAMRSIDFNDKTVLDYGAGTGILAILASKLFCSKVDAIDIEEESYLNIKENADINDIHNIQAIHGTLDHIEPSETYHIILANINRNILIQSCERLYDHLISGGHILLSGILTEDISKILEVFVNQGFNLEKSYERQGWACLHMSK